MRTALRCATVPAPAKWMSAVSVKSPVRRFQTKCMASSVPQMLAPPPVTRYSAWAASYSKAPVFGVTPRSPCAHAAGPRAGRHVVLEIVVAVRDPERGGMIEVSVKRNFIGSGILMLGGEDSGHIARVLRIHNPGAGQDAQISVQLVASLAAIFQVVAVAN